MINRFRSKGFRPQLESLEAREVPATPVQIGTTGITLSGALSTWNYSDGGSFSPSPVFADIDGNGTEELITVTGDRDVAAYTFGGGTNFNLLRTFDTGPGAGEIFTTPVVTFIPGLGNAVFVGDRNGALYGWNAGTGALLPGFPTSVDVPVALYPLGAERNSILGPLAAGDLDGDGVPEIVATSYNHHVTAFRWDGSVMWRYSNDDSVASGVAIGDLDRDGISEVVIGGDYSTNAFYDAGGNVTALSGPTGRRKWIKQLPQIGQSSPVLVDINGDGSLEVFIGTGINFTNLYGAAYPGNYVFGLDSQGNDLPGWPYATAPGSVEGRTPSPPAVADLNGDGVPEIIIGDYAGKIHVVRANGTALWTANFSSANLPLFAAPVVLDIDGDNDLDVVQLSGSEVRAFDGATGALTWSGFVEDGNTRQFINSPAVGRFKGNGSIQLAIMSNGSSQGVLPRSPSFVRLFDVAASTTTPQWWASRGDATSNVVRRPDVFVTNYLNSLGTYLGRDAAGTTSLVNAWRGIFRTAQSLETTSRGIIQSVEGQANEINRWYTSYLGRPAGEEGVNAWLPYLAGQANTFARIESLILGSVEAINLAGGTNAGWVSYMYPRLLGRTASESDIAAWSEVINSGQYSRVEVAFLFLMSHERTEKRVRDWYALFAPGNSTTPPEASLYAAAWDLRRQFHEETVILRLIGNGRISNSSDYLAMNFEGAWLKGMYRDQLQREASQADLVAWLRYLEFGGNLPSATYAIVNSIERNVLLVKSYYRRFLHRAVDPSTADILPFATQLTAGLPREHLIRDLLASAEYAAISGGTPTGYVNSLWQDFFGPGRVPDPAALTYWVNNPNVKQELPLALMVTDEYLFTTINADWMFPYLRRRPHTASNQSALFFGTSPDPFAPVRDWMTHMKAAVGRQQDIEMSILVSAEYILLARYGAFWTGKRWKI